MATKRTPEELLKDLEDKKQKLKERQKKLEAKARKQQGAIKKAERKKDDRRKILAGAYFLKLLQESKDDQAFETQMQRLQAFVASGKSAEQGRKDQELFESLREDRKQKD